MVKSAIYQIVNVLTGFRYIGSTENFSKRKRAHLYRLRKHIHENLHLQRAWDKYGEEAFRIFVIEYIDLEKLLTRETLVKGLKTGTGYKREPITWLIVSEPSLAVVNDKVRILFAVSAFKNDNLFVSGSGIKSMIIDVTAYKVYKGILSFIHVDDA